MAVVNLPPEVRATDGGFNDITSDRGVGLERMRADDIPGSVADAARDTPDEELLAQVVSMRWLQNTDHGGNNNWMLRDGNVVAVDFAATPAEEVWTGAAHIPAGIVDHGGLRARIDAMSPEVRAAMAARIAGVGEAELDAILDQIPGEWATLDERRIMRTELLRRKEEVLDDLA
jgi:hypothetical protein